MSIHIPTDHVAECAILFTDSAGLAKCENTFYLQDLTDDMFSDYTTLSTQIWNAFTSTMLGAANNDVIYNGVSIEDQRSLPYAGLIFPQTPTAGTISTGTTAMPNDNCLAIKRSTGVPGRSGRGRWYQPVWGQNQLSAQNTVTSTLGNAIVAALTAFQAAVEGGTFPCEMGIVSKQTGGMPRTAGLFQQITAWGYTDLVVDSQRRRLPGRGR